LFRVTGVQTCALPISVGALARIFEAFALWDRQKYEQAKKRLDDALPLFRVYCEKGGTRPGFRRFLSGVESARPFLGACAAEAQHMRLLAREKKPAAGHDIDGKAIPRDLVAAAIRRNEIEKDPEDGVMLLYAAVEKLARHTLLIRHGVDNAKVPPADLPDKLRKKLETRGKPLQGPVDLPLGDSYDLLASKGDELAARYSDYADAIRKLQFARNHCFREHGINEVRRDVFESRLGDVRAFLGLTNDEDLVRFPEPGGF
jgi:hypothetical protein